MPNGAGGPAQAAGAGMNGASMARSTAKTKIIKRYQNRKLYDTQQSCYVTLDDIAKMIRLSEDVVVIDNKSKNDITAATLTQIIFESEKKASQYAPLFTLREIIQNGNGSISGYLAKLGAIPKEYAAAQAAPLLLEKPVAEEVKQSLENRVAKAAAESADYASKASRLEAEEAPNLPTSSGGFNG
jgi:polyhydroxyalkanoate synthesis repressor PhaR